MRKIVFISIFINILGLLAIATIVLKQGGPSNILFKLSHKHALAKMKHRKSLFNNSPISKESIIFLGDSITEFGEWSEFFPNHTILNRGIAGDGIAGVQNRLKEIQRHQSRAVFLMIGVNDLCFHSPTEVIQMYKNLLSTMISSLMGTEIIVQSILPVNNTIYKTGTNNTQIDEVNDTIRTYCVQMNIPYIDLGDSFKNQENRLKKAFTSDGIHINGIAYNEWTKLLNHWLPIE